MTRLDVNPFGVSLRQQGDRFLVQAGAKQFAVSAHKVQSIRLTTGAHLSTDATALASAHHINLVFLTRHGEPYRKRCRTADDPVARLKLRETTEDQ